MSSYILLDDDIKFFNNSDLITVRTKTDNHFAYYNSQYNRYMMFCNLDTKHLSYSDYYEQKKHYCYQCRLNFIKNKKYIVQNYYCYIPESVAVSIRCCVKTIKGKRCKLYSNTHGSFCRMHYDKLIDIMSKRIPKEIVMSIMNL